MKGKGIYVSGELVKTEEDVVMMSGVMGISPVPTEDAPFVSAHRKHLVVLPLHFMMSSLCTFFLLCFLKLNVEALSLVHQLFHNRICNFGLVFRPNFLGGTSMKRRVITNQSAGYI
jgi:hypothetical protein